MSTEFGDNRFVDWNLSFKVERSPEIEEQIVNPNGEPPPAEPPMHYHKFEFESGPTSTNAGSRPSAPAPSGEPQSRLQKWQALLQRAEAWLNMAHVENITVRQFDNDHDVYSRSQHLSYLLAKFHQHEAESSPVDLQDAARKWFKEFADEIEDVDVRHLFLACDDDVVNMLAAFGAAVRRRGDRTMTFFGQGERPEVRECKPDLLSLADSLAEAARAIKKEYIANEGTKSAFASCMTEVSSYTKSASGKAMWRKWEKFMSALSAWDAARKG